MEYESAISSTYRRAYPEQAFIPTHTSPSRSPERKSIYPDSIYPRSTILHTFTMYLAIALMFSAAIARAYALEVEFTCNTTASNQGVAMCCNQTVFRGPVDTLGFAGSCKLCCIHTSYQHF